MRGCRRRDLVVAALIASAALSSGCGSAGSPDAGPPDAGPIDAGPIDAGPSTPLPCDVDAILEAHCRRCHGRPPTNLAPMSLVSWEDTQRPAPSDPSRPVWVGMEATLGAAPPTMPPEPDPPLSASETGVIFGWIDAGTPPGPPDASCAGP